MAKRAEKSRKPQCGWGKTGRIAQGTVLAAALVAGASALSAEPLEADAARTNPSSSLIAVERPLAEGAFSSGLSSPQISVSAFSAAQSAAARVLLAQELSGESNRAVGTAPFSGAPPHAGAARGGEAQVRVQEAAESKEADEVIVGRSLRAFTRSEEGSGASAPRRRAAFSSAISRAAAQGALTSANPNASVGTSLSSSRFAPAAGQFDPGFSQAADVLSLVPGLRLDSATIFGGYSSNSLPRSFQRGGSYGFTNQGLGADYDLGASAIISYAHQGRRSLTRFSYSPTHVQRSRIPEWSTTDHFLSFQTSRDLTPRLTLQATGNAGNSGLEQFWTRPPVLRQVTAPASFSELMNKVLAGEITNDEFAAILTGSPVVDDPGGNENGLTRIVTASVGTRASYSYSRRMTLSVGVRASANQLLRGDFRESDTSLPYLNFARVTSADAAADYRLSSRTRISVQHVTSYTNSTFMRSISQNPTVGLSQTLSRHWSYQLAAGIGTIYFDQNRTAWNIADTTTWTANGLLAYTSGAHQISLSAGRRVGDPSGFGSRSTEQASLMWNWQRRFSPWGVNAGIAFSRTDMGRLGQVIPNFSSDLYSAGFSRRLTPTTMFRSDYYYGEYISPFRGIASDLALHRLQMSLVWRPAESR
jgi:hypothetical protein